MQRKKIKYERSKLGILLDERELTLKDFAAMVYDKTGYFIAITNLSNMCTGFRPIRTIKVAQHFAKTLDVPLDAIL